MHTAVHGDGQKRVLVNIIHAGTKRKGRSYWSERWVSERYQDLCVFQNHPQWFGLRRLDGFPGGGQKFLRAREVRIMVPENQSDTKKQSPVMIMTNGTGTTAPPVHCIGHISLLPIL